MADPSAWWLVGVGVLLLVLLAWRQVALAVVVICATYGAAQHGVIDLRVPTVPAKVQQSVAERQATARERARRLTCERRAIAALSRDDGRALARVHVDCGDVFIGEPVQPLE